MEDQRRMSFHYPEGLAAVEDSSGAYHITDEEKAAYQHRFLKTFGFYEGVATAVDMLGYLHIGVDGREVHKNRYIWSGNFQGGLCVVEDKSGFYHVDKSGESAYPNRFTYIGDYRHGIAVAYQGTNAFHIDVNGKRIYDGNFEYAEPFHKGFSVVRDSGGYFHIDISGRPIHELKLKRAEPFYNNYAFCEDNIGNLIRLKENGQYTYLNGQQGEISIEEIVDEINKGSQVALLVRHSDRHVITEDTPNWGNNVTLNESGVKRAKHFGSKLSDLGSVQLVASPIYRCIQTCECIAQGIYNDTRSPEVNSFLGDPGIYFDGSFDHEKEMTENFHHFVEGYLATGLANGMTPLASASEELNQYIVDKMSDSNVTVMVTHDLHAVCMMQFLGLKKPDKDDWCEYLEGICYIKDNGSISVRLLTYLKDGFVC